MLGSETTTGSQELLVDGGAPRHSRAGTPSSRESAPPGRCLKKRDDAIDVALVQKIGGRVHQGSYLSHILFASITAAILRIADELQEIAIRIVHVDTRGGHPPAALSIDRTFDDSGPRSLESTSERLCRSPPHQAEVATRRFRFRCPQAEIPTPQFPGGES